MLKERSAVQSTMSCLCRPIVESLQTNRRNVIENSIFSIILKVSPNNFRAVAASFSKIQFANASSGSSAGPSFGLSDEQREFQDVARKFTREEIIPVAAELDRTGKYPIDIVKKAHAIGLLNSHIPAEVGGIELDILTGCVIAEELAYGCTGVKTALEGSGLGVSFLFCVFRPSNSIFFIKLKFDFL